MFALFIMCACSTEYKEPPDRKFFEKHLMEGLHLGSNESRFKEIFGSSTCRRVPHANSPYSHQSYSTCKLDPNKPAAINISIPPSGTIQVVHYEAEFFYDRLESIIFQFFSKDYNRVYKNLEAILGKPSKQTSKRISGPLGPTVNKNKTTLWKLPEYSIKLQSRPGGGSISLLQFYTDTYPLRLKEPYEKYLKETPDVSAYNRKHYENKIKSIETDY
jgi:hypothetical protein